MNVNTLRGVSRVIQPVIARQSEARRATREVQPADACAWRTTAKIVFCPAETTSTGTHLRMHGHLDVLVSTPDVDCIICSRYSTPA